MLKSSVRSPVNHGRIVLSIDHLISGETTNATLAFLPATVVYAHDANGNLTSDGRRRFDYDAENQLARVTLSTAARSEFVYDGLARRRVLWSGQGWKPKAGITKNSTHRGPRPTLRAESW